MRIQQTLVAALLVVFSANAMPLEAQTKRTGETTATIDYDIQLDTISSGYDGKTCWVHARAGAIPGGVKGNEADQPLVVMTTQKLLLTGSDIFYRLHQTNSNDIGATWTNLSPSLC